VINSSSELRCSACLTAAGRVLASASCRIRRIRKGDSESLPVLTDLVERLLIEREPGMAIEIRNFFSHTTLKKNRIPQSPSEPIERQRPRETIPFFVIGKQLKPAIYIVDQISHHRLVRPPRHRARIQSVQQQRQTFDPQQETNPQHDQAYTEYSPILFYESDHDGFSVASLNMNSSIRRFQIQKTDGPIILARQGRLSTSRRDPRRHGCRP
jgi:hypothetical protein